MGMSIDNVAGGVNLKAAYITATRDLTAASGDVAYTGVGFQPKALLALGVVDNTSQVSIGVSGETIGGGNAAANEVTASPAWWDEAKLIVFTPVAGNAQHAILKSYDGDGFTLTWTKFLAPTGTAKLLFLCLSTG